MTSASSDSQDFGAFSARNSISHSSSHSALSSAGDLDSHPISDQETLIEHEQTDGQGVSEVEVEAAEAFGELHRMLQHLFRQPNAHANARLNGPAENIDENYNEINVENNQAERGDGGLHHQIPIQLHAMRINPLGHRMPAWHRHGHEIPLSELRIVPDDRQAASPFFRRTMQAFMAGTRSLVGAIIAGDRTQAQIEKEFKGEELLANDFESMDGIEIEKGEKKLLEDAVNCMHKASALEAFCLSTMAQCSNFFYSLLQTCRPPNLNCIALLEGGRPSRALSCAVNSIMRNHSIQHLALSCRIASTELEELLGAAITCRSLHTLTITSYFIEGLKESELAAFLNKLLSSKRRLHLRVRADCLASPHNKFETLIHAVSNNPLYSFELFYTGAHRQALGQSLSPVCKLLQSSDIYRFTFAFSVEAYSVDTGSSTETYARMQNELLMLFHAIISSNSIQKLCLVDCIPFLAKRLLPINHADAAADRLAVRSLVSNLFMEWLSSPDCRVHYLTLCEASTRFSSFYQIDDVLLRLFEVLQHNSSVHTFKLFHESGLNSQYLGRIVDLVLANSHLQRIKAELTLRDNHNNYLLLLSRVLSEKNRSLLELDLNLHGEVSDFDQMLDRNRRATQYACAVSFAKVFEKTIKGPLSQSGLTLASIVAEMVA